MADSVLVCLCPWLAGEERRELLVEVDQVLCVLTTLKFILDLRSDDHPWGIQIFTHSLQEGHISQSSEDVANLPNCTGFSHNQTS